MAAKMLNFGGTITASTLGQGNGSCVIAKAGTSDPAFALRSERADGSTVIIFSMVLNNKLTTTDNINVDLWLVDNNNLSNAVSVGKGITVVPGRPISLDYKITMTPSNSLYVTATSPNVEIVISAVQM